MRYVSDEAITKAREIDLLTYLQNYEPYELVKLGNNNFSTKTHPKLKMSNGMWCYWMEGNKGYGGKSALDYLVKVREIDFVSAVEMIAGKVAITPPSFVPQTKREDIEFILPDLNYRCRTVKPYLMSRGIDPDIIDYCIEKRILAESNKYQNALFIGMDDDTGEAKQCSVRMTREPPVKRDLNGTVKKPFNKWEIEGSRKEFAFKLLSESNRKTLRMFESAIDLLSFASIAKSMGRDFTKENMLSIAGVYRTIEGKEYKTPVAIEKYLNENPETELVILNFDNDEAGQLAATGVSTSLSERVKCEYRPPPMGKDFNDFLLTKFQKKREIVRENCMER